MTTWEPQTYLRYADIRFRAGIDLIARIPKLDYQVIYDLGCGTGHLTRILADTFPSSKVTGIDSSREMLSEARREFPALNWQQADLTSWRPPAPPHLIYTNAALQWVPDHETLLPSLMNKLQPAGVLAMPHRIGAPIALSHSATGDLLALVIAARSQSRHLGIDLSAGAGWQGSGGQLYARYRTASLPFGSTREGSWEVCRGIR